MKLDYYQPKVNVQVISRVVESPEQKILGNPRNAWNDGEHAAHHPQGILRYPR